MNRPLLFVSIAAAFLAFSSSTFAHSEHDKARFVAPKGKDIGNCDNALRPCKSIAYAVNRSNKGDRVLVAGGGYTINSIDELFYLKSSVVSVTGGYNRFDHFQSQSPELNPTILTGISLDMAPDLEKRGFTVVVDGKSRKKREKLQRKLAKFSALDQKQINQPCVNGLADIYECNNIDLVAHIPLNQFGTSPNEGNDIWGHIDLNTGKEYAIMGVRNGVSVFDVSTPDSPVEVGSIPGEDALWRDIKVYQYFDSALGIWQAYAYVTIDGPNSNGLTIVDLNQLPEKITLAELNDTVVKTHNVYISNVDYSFNFALPNTSAILQLIGSNKNGGLFNNYDLSSPGTVNQLTQTPSANDPSGRQYTHDGTSLVVSDSRKDVECINSSNPNCTVFVDFNEDRMNIWDITNTDSVSKLSSVTYDNPQYVHSGWWSEDRKFVFVHDELDEAYNGINTTLRVFNIESLKNPVEVGSWVGETAAIDHNGFVRGNRYYMSNYERGLTVLDITDPATPVEVGSFDTYPVSDNTNFNGAWGVYPYLPSGLILVSDMNSGLYILRDNTKQSDQGSLSFDNADITVEQETTATIVVKRNGAQSNASSVSVSYEMLTASAQASDFIASEGTLTWQANDMADKTIEVPINSNTAGKNSQRHFFVKLVNPTNSATLGEHSYKRVTINGAAIAGAISIENDQFTIGENSGSFTIDVMRSGGNDGELSINYQLVSDTALVDYDVETNTGTLVWADGEVGSKSITINIINDTDSESNETVNLILTSLNGAQLGNISRASIVIRDDESNTPPSITIDENKQVNSRQSVTISSSATDAEADAISYQWTQTSGSSVDITNADESTMSFVAPSAAGTLSFTLTATDSLGAASESQVTITVIAATPETTNSSGGGSFGFLSMLALAMFLIRKSTK